MCGYPSDFMSLLHFLLRWIYYRKLYVMRLDFKAAKMSKMYYLKNLEINPQKTLNRSFSLVGFEHGIL